MSAEQWVALLGAVFGGAGVVIAKEVLVWWLGRSRERRKMALAERRGEIAETDFIADSAIRLLEPYRSELMRLRERIRELEEENRRKGEIIAKQEEMIRDLQAMVARLQAEVNMLRQMVQVEQDKGAPH